MTPTRWYLKRASAGILLIVERADEAPARGYRLYVSDRHHAREELPHLRRLVEAIGEPAPPMRVYDAVSADDRP